MFPLIIFVFVATAFPGGVNSAAESPIPYGETKPGHFTFYAGSGKTACGIDVDREKTPSVAVSCKYWDMAGNSNKDPICNNVCVKVTYKGKSITVPVTDQCCGCEPDHLDLAKVAFLQLEPQGGVVGDAKNATWNFIKCDGSQATQPSDSSESDNGWSSDSDKGSSETDSGSESDSSGESGSSGESSSGESSSGSGNNNVSSSGNSNAGKPSGSDPNSQKSIPNGMKDRVVEFMNKFKSLFGSTFGNVRSFFPG